MDLAIGIVITLIVAAVGMWYSYKLGRGARAEAEREKRVQFASEVVSLSQQTSRLTSASSDDLLMSALHEERRLRELAKMRGWTDAGQLVEYAGLVTNADLADLRPRRDPRESAGLEQWESMSDIAAMWVDNPTQARRALQAQGWELSITSGVSGSVENLKQWHAKP